jgi:diguanylate cyclase (GGDEF)-like protein
MFDTLRFDDPSGKGHVGNVLISNPDAGERSFLFDLAHGIGTVLPAPTIDRAMAALRSSTFELVLADVGQALDPSLRSHLPLVPGVILTGRDEGRLKEALRIWPPDQFADYILISLQPADLDRARRVLATAVEYGRLKSAVTELLSSKDVAEQRLRRISREIKGLGSSLTADIARELEKRIEVELRYRRFLKTKERIEDTIRRLYSAEDVSYLLDIVGDIRDLLEADSLSLYLVEESPRLGRYLKPLVWDGSIPEHGDLQGHIAPFEAADFASYVARTGMEINATDPGADARCSIRYRKLLRKPLRGLLAAPLKRGSEVIGLIEAYNKLDAGGGPAAFGPEDARILRGLCEHVTLAITKLNLIQYDALTALLRPDPFFEKAVQKIETRGKRRRESGAWAMVMGDVDWFKAYNDRNGQEAGNRLLHDLAGLLKSSIREDDLLCRYGGEEFLFLLAGVKDIEEAFVLTERIRRKASDHHFENEEFQPRGDVTMSFGVTVIDPANDARVEPVTREYLKEIVAEADLALADAKGKPRAGRVPASPEEARNRVCAYVRWKAAVLTKASLLEELGKRPFVEKRRDPRHFASTLCLYRENGHHRVVSTIDVSFGGAKITSPVAIPSDRPLEMFLVLGSRAQPLLGDIIYTRQASPGSPYFHSGIRFRDLTLEGRSAFEDYFRSLAPQAGGRD